MARALHPLLLVWFLLLLLLTATVAASFLFSGIVGFAIGVSIAAVKAGLIYWRYMHLDEEEPLLRIAALAAAAWLMILLVFLCADDLTRAL
ncbi:cytochrome C oxidase subunit IV family protein [Rhizobium sp. 2YAF20]|uniref:cytochrome C oxidase subunit IV family protein n=1 Tax=Rhizobium sp. 2YAF20 TaxID=3233027 RepID=UPI003F9DF7B2